MKVLQVQSPDMVGRPTVFASHAWRYKFSSFVAAVEVALDDLARERASAGLPPRTEYVWNDIFVEDQNSTMSKPEGYFFNVGGRGGWEYGPRVNAFWRYEASGGGRCASLP